MGLGDCRHSLPPRCAFRSPSRRSGSLGRMVSSTSSTCCHASRTGWCGVGGMYVLIRCSACPPSVAITVRMYSSIYEVASTRTCCGIKVANPPPLRFSHATCSTWYPTGAQMVLSFVSYRQRTTHPVGANSSATSSVYCGLRLLKLLML